jgi:serine/threonine protein kinase
LDRKTGQTVALKMLSPEAGRDPDVVERMLREQQALVALSGTCAVTAIDLCRLESGAPCLVMEWLEGHDLEEQLSDWEAQRVHGSSKHLLGLLQPVTETLEQAHRLGIVHRDIKPANIFVTDGPQPGARLLDFGLSRLSSAAPLTEVGMVMGSPSYISPETWRGQSATLDGRADLYSLAVIVFRWLTGRLPFEAKDLVGKMMAATSAERPSAVALRRDLPEPIDAWVKRGLAIDPAERFQSGRDFYVALEEVLAGRPLPAARAPGRVIPAFHDNLQSGKRAVTTALKAAAGLLKRFTVGRDSAPELAPAAPPPAAEEPSTPSQRNTLWLDSEALEPVAGSKAPTRNTLWLDSAELEPVAGSKAPTHNTLWLDSEALEPVKAAVAAAEGASRPPPPPPKREKPATATKPKKPTKKQKRRAKEKERKAKGKRKR